MLKGRFAQEMLLRTSAKARADCRDKLLQCADGRGDVIGASISPDLEAAKWLCAFEEARWGRDIRGEKRIILVSACFLVLSLFALFSSSAAVYAAASVFAAIGWIALLGIAALVCAGSFKGFAGGCMRLRGLLLRGYSEGALRVLTNHGRSLWLVGSDGLYVALNNAPVGHAPNIGFIKFDELRAPLLDCFKDQACVTLITTGKCLVRVMIFPGNAADQAREAAGLVGERTSRG